VKDCKQTHDYRLLQLFDDNERLNAMVLGVVKEEEEEFEKMNVGV